MIDVKTLRNGSCHTLSGSSTLAYEIGADVTGKPYLQVVSSTGGGRLSKEWIAINVIQSALKGTSPITSNQLRPTFRGKSANAAGFLLAVLVKEKLVEPLPDKTRHFKLLDPALFLDCVAKLTKSVKTVASKPSTKASAKKTPPKKKTK